MKIKQIEFFGFKSFADRTVLAFDEEISAIVGPNGCGKSNLLDGLRWVMGEMSAKSLRGSAMADVIFAGTDERKPMGMAEINLVLDTSAGAPAGYEGCAEIMITRRLYRSAESEYLINKVPCRLRDINELFMDTGLGVRAYSMIEQGQIDRLIAAKPLQRRSLIEEAAGITKYKARKDEALRKVDSTQQNMLRVNDLIAEITRSVNSLARQAGKARRYHEFKTELRGIDLAVSAREYAGLQFDSDLINGRMARIARQVEQAAGGLEAEELAIQDNRLTLLELEKRLNNWQSELFEIHSAIQAAETEYEHLTREAGKLEQSIESAQAEIADYGNRRDQLESERDKLAKERNALLVTISESDGELANLESQLIEARGTVEQLASGLDEQKSELVDLLTEEAQLKGSREAAAARIADAQERNSEGSQRLTANAEQNDELSARLSEIESDLAALTKSEQEAGAERDDLARRRQALLDEGSGLGERYEDIKGELESRRVRLKSLKAMRDNLEGYQRGVQSILRHAGGDHPEPLNVRGVVADFLDTDQRYETALEAVLGDRLQGVVVDDQTCGISAIEYLKSSSAGRSTFIPMNLRQQVPNQFGNTALSMAECPLREVVNVKTGYETVADYLLGDTLLVKDIDTAHRVWKANGYRGMLVTIEGELLDDRGAMTGGTPESVQSGILQAKREIKQLEQEISGLAKSYTAAESSYLMNKGLAQKVADKLEQAQEQLRRLHIDRINIENARDNAGSELRDLGSERQRLTDEGSALVQRAERDGKLLADAEQRLSTIVAERERIGGTVRELDARLRTDRAALDNSLAELSERRIEISALRERADQLGSSLTRIERSRADLGSVVERRNREIASAGQRLEQIAATKTELKTKLGTLHAQRDEHAAGLRKVQEEYESGRSALTERESGLKRRQREIDRLRDEQRSCDVSLTEARMKLEHVTGQVIERYNIELTQQAAQHLEFESDPVAQSQRRRDLRQKIEQMGEVNPNAVEEHAEQRERLEFYTTQREDLLKAMDTLKRTITRINQTSRKLFSETFERVNEQFQAVIPILFGGGSARLELTESDDVLEAGLDIVVRPPGKRLTNVSLLSGGEKALAAIGLIFSLFLIKPSPFCVLDEVDAPLDDSNIDRFNSLLHEMNQHSQLVLITHNKRTMEIANQLYGVTMEEKGVSKIVSVKLN
ncbi:MAG: chromosome segregation protein SMC [Candidatus Alcyoniella australis]|nr:chromosome segregation protein SMC [Candidatus Alcyoniella australis]